MQPLRLNPRDTQQRMFLTIQRQYGMQPVEVGQRQADADMAEIKDDPLRRDAIAQQTLQMTLEHNNHQGIGPFHRFSKAFAIRDNQKFRSMVFPPHCCSGEIPQDELEDPTLGTCREISNQTTRALRRTAHR